MKYLKLAVLALSLLSGCVTMDAALSTRGVIDSRVSKIDETRVVTMSPVLSKHGMTDIQAEFGLYWDNKKNDRAFLIVEIDGAKSFSPERPFEIKVDGALMALSPAADGDYGDIETIYGSKYIPAHNKTRKSFSIQKNQILKIANAKEAAYRVWFVGGRYAEGEISYEYPDLQSYVPLSFRTFYSQVWK